MWAEQGQGQTAMATIFDALAQHAVWSSLYDPDVRHARARLLRRGVPARVEAGSKAQRLAALSSNARRACSTSSRFSAAQTQTPQNAPPSPKPNPVSRYSTLGGTTG